MPGLWGPQRTVYRCEAATACQGADHITFNSTINTPNYGDERTFVDVKPAAFAASGGFQNVLKVTRGGEILILRAYISNNANTALRAQHRDLALRTRLHFMVPAEPGRQLAPMAVISASNAVPPAVWDGAWLYADWPFRLDYIFGSARITSRDPRGCTDVNRPTPVQSARRNVPVPDDVVSDGVLIGYPELDGRYPSPFCAGSLATIRIKVVRTHG